ncbi:MAG: hypothetical protein K5765_01850, partial [Clostridia bacterium]|nr:hypothetical protein [Clostridia bacterium]
SKIINTESGWGVQIYGGVSNKTHLFENCVISSYYAAVIAEANREGINSYSIRVKDSSITSENGYGAYVSASGFHANKTNVHIYLKNNTISAKEGKYGTSQSAFVDRIHPIVEEE